MRGSQSLPGWCIAVALALLAGCAASPPAKPGPTERFDGGALVIVPQAVRPTVVTGQAARFDLSHSEVAGYDWALQSTAFGLVTVSPSAVSVTAGMPTPTAPSHRLAWVLFFSLGRSSCPAQPIKASPKPINPIASGRNALIVDATDGTAWVYSGIGSGNCVSATRATLENAFQQVSVPWTDLGGGRIRLSLPGCAKAGGGTPAEGRINGPTTIEALGERRIAPCHSAPTSAIATVNFPRPWIHGALGAVPTGQSGA